MPQKKIKTSLHNHSNLSDGARSPEEMIREAIARGFTHFAITDHISTLDYEETTVSPEDFKDYVSLLRKLKEKYKDEIDFSIGFETEYYLDTGSLNSDPSPIRDELDFVVGSVHNVYKDGHAYPVEYFPSLIEEVLEKHYNFDSVALVKDYFKAYNQMLLDIKPEIAGHMDVIKKNNFFNIYFYEDSPWYIDCVEETLENIKKIDAILELNTGGAAKHGLRCIYPGNDILKRVKEKNIKMTITSDAHDYEMLDCLYDTGIKRLKAAGIKELYTYDSKNNEFFSFKI